MGKKKAYKNPTSSLCGIQRILVKYTSLNPTQLLLLLISSVKQNKDHVEIIFKSGRRIKAFFDGHYEKYNINGKLCSKGGFGTSRGIHNGRIIIKADFLTINLERLILIAFDIIHNTVMLNYNNVEANVLDGSGNINTAIKLQIRPDFSINNLEWCSKKENVRHGNMIEPLYNLTGNVYRFSAKDRKLSSLYYNSNKNTLSLYCIKHLTRVR